MLKRKVEVQSRDLHKQRLSEAELDERIGERDYKESLNSRNELFRERRMKEEPPSRTEPTKLMAKQPKRIRRLIVVKGSPIILGLDEEAYRKL